MSKPSDLFDRHAEWAALAQFVDSPSSGSLLGLVYGRRRQGKTFLLETLTTERRGFYFAALRQSSLQNLDRLAEAYRRFTRARVGVRFANWEEAFAALLALGEGSDDPVVVVIDEFPYLLESNGEIPSVLQDLLKPRGEAARQWRTRLILCGSALSTMRSLLAGTAPLRGRASLELTVHPFGFREGARFWGVDGDPDTAVRLHALVGGTPAYVDMCGGRRPSASEPFEAWVAAALLNPASAMFREGNVLLSEDNRVSDTAPYLAVLAAISSGATRRGQIAAAIGRAPTALAHPLTVLAEARLIDVVQDAVKQRRSTYVIAEPLLRLHELIITPNERRLVRHEAAAVWKRSHDTVSSKIYGPHFEELARTWCAEYAAPASMGGTVDSVGPTEVSCRHHRQTHEVDVVALAKPPHAANRIVALGEAKWRTTAPGLQQLRRLEHIRGLLDATDAHLLLFSRAPFGEKVSAEAAAREDVELVDLDRLYHGS